jgi:hypothetical protein
MYDANVHGTERVLDAAAEAGAKRIVYVSTVGIFGNTHGKVVDETYSRDGEDFLSCYEETKYRSHEVALDRISKGAPIVIVQPGGAYGPGDHSELGNIIDQARTGKLKPPSRELPVPLMKMAIPIGPLVGGCWAFRLTCASWCERPTASRTGHRTRRRAEISATPHAIWRPVCARRSARGRDRSTAYEPPLLGPAR